MSIILPYDVTWNPREKVEQPDGKLLLVDGRVIDGYERKGERPQPASGQLLTENAFFLLANYEKILSDSRMFLAPIGVVSGLAYIGSSMFARPTLGIYIEWWLMCDAAVLSLKDTQPNLLWYLAGSPLSGCNRCSCVNPEGIRTSIEVRNFSSAWGRFVSINGRYKEAKDRYEAYSLEEVITQLHADPDHKSADHIVAMMMTRQCMRLKEEKEEMRKRASELEIELEIAHTRLHLDEARVLYEEMMIYVNDLENDVVICQAQIRDVKARLHAGEITAKTAQGKITGLRAQKDESRRKILNLRSEYSNKLKTIDPMITLRGVERAL